MAIYVGRFRWGDGGASRAMDRARRCTSSGRSIVVRIESISASAHLDAAVQLA
jgi:hypothetical protein